MVLPWETLKAWKPFGLPALGLVTLLGADEVARAVGNLASNNLTEFMPLLGAYKIAGNQFVAVEPGFVMYNLTDGIMNTEFSAWFTRWLSQFVPGDSAIELELVEQRNRIDYQMLSSFVLGTLIHFALVAFAALQSDQYGVANACALYLATLARNYLLSANRRKYDERITRALKKDPKTKRPTFGNIKDANRPLFDRPAFNETKKVVIVRPDGRLVVMNIRLGILLTLFGKLDPAASKFFSFRWHGFYTVTRGIGWFLFGVHIVSIGQASLPSQIAAVIVMAISTMATIFNVGTQRTPSYTKRWPIAPTAETERQSDIRQTSLGGMNLQHERVESEAMAEQQSEDWRCDIGRWLTIKVLPLKEDALPKPANTMIQKDGSRVQSRGRAANQTAQSSNSSRGADIARGRNSTRRHDLESGKSSSAEANTLSKPLKKSPLGRRVSKEKQPSPNEPKPKPRRQMYFLLAPDETQQRWMREWGLLALMPNEKWYADWYQFLGDWKNNRDRHPVQKPVGFLGLGDDEYERIYLGQNSTRTTSRTTEVRSPPVPTMSPSRSRGRSNFPESREALDRRIAVRRALDMIEPSWNTSNASIW